MHASAEYERMSFGSRRKPVTGGKTVAEQLQQVNLTASGGQRQKIQIVDMDIALAVRLACAGSRINIS